MFDEDVKLSESLKPKGHVKLELIDKDTKEVVDTVEGDNFISKGMEWLYQLQMKMLFMSGRYNDNVSKTLIGDVLENITLTDAQHDAKPDKEWVMQGLVIGVGKTTNNSLLPGATGGQYSDTESFTTESMMRVVIDYPASSANGSIGSVYFHPSKNPISGDNPLFFRLHTMYSGMLNRRTIYHEHRFYTIYERSMRVADGGFGRYDEPLILEIHNEDGDLLSIKALDTKDRYYEPSTVGIAVRGSKLVIIWGRRAFSFDLSEIDSLQDTVVAKDTALTLTSTSIEITNPEYLDIDYTKGYGGLIYDKSNDRYITVSMHDDATSGSAIDIVSKDFTLLNRIPIESGGALGVYSYIVRHLEDGLIYLSSGVVDISSGVFTPNGFSDLECVIDDRYFLAGRTVYPKFGFTSRYHLPSPVVKTEQHIMKVTYDFKFPSIYGNKET